MKTKMSKRRFSQAKRDELERKKAKAILAYRKAREEVDKTKQALKEYDRTHH